MTDPRLKKDSLALVVAVICSIWWQPVIAQECILSTEMGLGHRIHVAGQTDSWTDAELTLPTTHENKQGYLRIQASGTWKSGHDNSAYTKVVTYIHSWTSYFSSFVSSSNNEDASGSSSCQLDSCFTSGDVNRCLARGSVISDSSPRPCTLQDGVGLIGKISSQEQWSDTDHVFFAHSNESTEEGIAYFNLIPRQPKQSNASAKGKLYLKILDIYEESEGGYTVRISSDLKEKNPGFFEESFAAFENAITGATRTIIKSSPSSWPIHRIFTACIVLYTAISGMAFMMGLMPYKKEEMIQWLLKLCFICALTHPDVFDACLNYAEQIFIHASKELANTIMHATTKEMLRLTHATPHENLNQTMMEVFDNTLRFYFSPSMHLKIWSLLFSKYLLYIPLIYIIIWIFLMACVRSAILYIISITMLMVLLTMAPIMMCLMLFKASRKIFDSWLRSVINCSLLNIFISAAMALFAAMLLKHTIIPLQHAICHEPLSSSNYINNLVNIMAWKPYDAALLIPSSLLDYLSHLLLTLTFLKVVSEIPVMVDSIAPALYNQSPLLHMLNSGAIDKLQDKASTAISFRNAVVREEVITPALRHVYNRLFNG